MTRNGVIGEVTVIDPKAMQMIVKTDAGSAIHGTLNMQYKLHASAAGREDAQECGQNHARGCRWVTACGRAAKRLRIRSLSGQPDCDDQGWHCPEAGARRCRVQRVALQTRLRRSILRAGDHGQRRAGREGERPMTIVPASDARFRRYAPDSVKFSDAKSSSSPN